MKNFFNKKQLVKDLALEAKALEIPSGAAEIFIDKAITQAEEKLSDKKIITQNDLERIIGAELKKYNADFAYVYKNRDKII